MLGPMTFASTERRSLGTLLLDVGPDAPTLCEGWNTHHLAVHLYIRENRPLATPGMFLAPLGGVLEKETRRQMERPYEDVVREWAAGPPLPMRPIDQSVNTAENFIHHEDVRRGDGVSRPRDFSAAVNGKLYKAAKIFGTASLRKSPVPVIVTPPSLPPLTLGERHGVAERGDNVIRVFGEPGELLLWLSGRSAADVRVEGDDALVEQVTVKLGI